MTPLNNQQVAYIAALAAKKIVESKGAIRMGQALFNALQEVSPATAYDVSNSTKQRVDPFYSDERIPAFWKFIT
jgi:hypothetical protein